MTLKDSLYSILIFQTFAFIIHISFIATSIPLNERIHRGIKGYVFGFFIFSFILYCCGSSIFIKSWNQKVFSLDVLAFDFYILSMLLSVLIVVPLFIQFSFDEDKLRNVLITDYSNWENAVFSFPFWTTIIGAICGGGILALDWFRPYQLFPIPCLIGACCGHWLGFIAIFILIFCCSQGSKQE